MKLEVTNSPFNEQQVQQLNEIFATLTQNQKIWLTGYLSATALVGTQSTNESTVVEQPSNSAGVLPTAKKAPSKHITVLYASQTGNASKLAKKYGEQLQKFGFEVNVSSMSDFKTNALKKLDHLLVIASTHGEGEPPDNAIAFHSYLYGKRAPRLDHVKFAVLSLGDSSYEFFCKTGQDFDEQLEKLGAQRLVDRVDCDLDYDEPAAKWFDTVKEKLQEDQVSGQTLQEAAPTVLESSVQYTRKNPFNAEILEKINLNAEGSNKETIHLELSLENSGITFEPGDSLAIYPKNNENLVSSLIAALGFNAEKSVNVEGEEVTLKDALTNLLEVTVLSKQVMQKIGEYTLNDDFHALLADRTAFKSYTHGRDLLDIVEKFAPYSWDEQNFVNVLRKLPARQYSISSSLAAYPDEVHVTIGAVRYELEGRERLGVCSTHVADNLEIGDHVRVYVQQNPNFKLPTDDKPIIMVGPGTGVAPFRSFIQEREERGAEGKNWLFFGDQHFVTDFLYQTEWQSWLKSGVLTKLDLAFSRDRAEKVYVQHKMQKHAAEIFEWLEQGAYFFVCGDKDQMAADVHNTLLHIIADQGNKTEEQAKEYLENLRKQKRYQRDVY
ncbi:assimilatory sulfite reductase (NADPH) flavoprotein subunit [Ureibacillus sinduriensis]|uniref:assimilatory sulfite reductase (NADPH) n=1 Tax=Ureibacillus sinduriensis BLB-1 = JCM 15800 TaxID=1384057 RepID=A0A0A3I4J9_9BACL|nr:assimilatory sulfite reductase (NADPH) flavoprotein subunit [Ureibacillus sinduriensis]KGR78435.1 sulfite reductase [NADPH] flavoprotein alpha-component [Ureibacillus sinduriensis BLB-1 = JCM 15800]